MSFAYESSAVFDSLKATEETIPGNMTSFQYLGVLDELLARSFSPIVADSNFPLAFVSPLCGWQEKNFRRKLSFGHRRDALAKALEFLVCPQSERVAAFKKIMFERGVRVEMVKAFLAHTEVAYKASAFDPDLRESDESQEDFEARCRYIVQQAQETLECPDLIRVRRQAEYWLTQATSFRERILQKYYRLCLSTAQREYVNHFRCSVPLDDVIGTYLMATMRAIDKCDIRQGVLTSHITTWFLTARDNVGKSKASNSVSLNEAVPLDGPEFFTASHEDGLVESEMRLERLQVISAVAALVDTTGAARTFLRINEPDIQQ